MTSSPDTVGHTGPGGRDDPPARVAGRGHSGPNATGGADPLANGSTEPTRRRWLDRRLTTPGQRRGLAILAGLLCALSLPPSPAWPLMPLGIALAVLAWQRAARGWEVIWLGWWFGFTQQVLLLYWLAAALFVDIASWWWAVPVAVGAFPALLGIVFALQVRLQHWLGWRGVWLLGGFPLLWMAAEMIRGHAFTGFPWMTSGYAGLGWLPLAQAGAYVGLYALGGLMALAGVLLALVLSPGVRAVRVGAGVAFIGLLALWAALGALRIERHSDVAAAPAADAPRLRLVQPNIAQGAKWDPAAAVRNLATLLRLSVATAPVDAILWPETAAPFFLEWQTRAREMADIALVVQPGQQLITGANRRVARGLDAPAEAPRFTYYNSLYVYDDRLREVAIYDKHHLVPFGEYQPLSGLLPVPAVATGSAQFTAGPTPAVIDVPGLPPFIPSICYEIIFPHLANDPATRANWLLTITNDGWFGVTLGPHQHFHMARMRAIEQGLPLVRVANTGISGQVDALGRVQARTGLGESAQLDLVLLSPLEERPPASKASFLVVWVVIFSLFVLTAIRGLRLVAMILGTSPKN